MIKLSLITILLTTQIACTREPKNQPVPSDLVLIEFAAALEEEQEKFQAQPLGPHPSKDHQ